MLEANSAMINKLSALKISQLLEVWNHTENTLGSKENVIIRDGVIKVIEEKYPVIYETWINNDYSKNPEGDKLEYYFKKQLTTN
jgi:hypothetical protein